MMSTAGFPLDDGGRFQLIAPALDFCHQCPAGDRIRRRHPSAGDPMAANMRRDEPAGHVTDVVFCSGMVGMRWRHRNQRRAAMDPGHLLVGEWLADGAIRPLPCDSAIN
jgi:hypothetical protein